MCNYQRYGQFAWASMCEMASSSSTFFTYIRMCMVIPTNVHSKCLYTRTYILGPTQHTTILHWGIRISEFRGCNGEFLGWIGIGTRRSNPVACLVLGSNIFSIPTICMRMSGLNAFRGLSGNFMPHELWVLLGSEVVCTRGAALSPSLLITSE